MGAVNYTMLGDLGRGQFNLGDQRGPLATNPNTGVLGPGATGPAGENWFTTQGPAGGGAADLSWWNPQDPQGSIARLFAGRPTTSQTILELAPQLQAAGIEISPPNAEGVTSKIHVPGIGWTRILDGGVAGGQGTGWTWMPQGSTGPGGTIPMGGGGGAAAANVAPGGGGPGGRYDPDYDARLGLNGEWQTDPGYQFRLKEGQQAIERSAASRGTLLTGGTVKGIERYAQGVASDEYQRRYQRLLGEQQNRYNQLMGLSTLGYGAASQQANLGAGQAAATGDLITGGGNAQAAGTIGTGTAWQSGLSGLSNIAQMYYLSRLMQQPGGGGSPYGDAYLH